MPWIVDLLAGAALGLTLYALVRLRMLLAPWAHRQLGQVARLVTWVVTMGLMILAANVGLVGLRIVLHRLGQVELLLHELGFAFAALIVGYLLVSGYVNRSRADSQTDFECGLRK